MTRTPCCCYWATLKEKKSLLIPGMLNRLRTWCRKKGIFCEKVCEDYKD